MRLGKEGEKKKKKKKRKWKHREDWTIDEMKLSATKPMTREPWPTIHQPGRRWRLKEA